MFKKVQFEMEILATNFRADDQLHKPFNPLIPNPTVWQLVKVQVRVRKDRHCWYWFVGTTFCNFENGRFAHQTGSRDSCSRSPRSLPSPDCSRQSTPLRIAHSSAGQCAGFSDQPENSYWETFLCGRVIRTCQLLTNRVMKYEQFSAVGWGFFISASGTLDLTKELE